MSLRPTRQVVASFLMATMLLFASTDIDFSSPDGEEFELFALPTGDRATVAGSRTSNVAWDWRTEPIPGQEIHNEEPGRGPDQLPALDAEDDDCRCAQTVLHELNSSVSLYHPPTFALPFPVSWDIFHPPPSI